MKEKSPHAPYKCYTFLAALYITIFLSTIILSRKLIQLDFLIIAVATIIIPFGYGIADIITEVYGYAAARHLLWVYIVCGFIFSMMMELAVISPPPATWPFQQAYIAVLGHSLQISTASMLGLLFGVLINSYALAKWKILLKGKYFWMRSLGSSAIGEFVFVIIALPLSQFNNHIRLKNLIILMIVSYVSKLLFTCISVIPISIIAAHIKKIENLDTYDFETKFNPFIIQVNHDNK